MFIFLFYGLNHIFVVFLNDGSHVVPTLSGILAHFAFLDMKSNAGIVSLRQVVSYWLSFSVGKYL